jgi:putative PEP-CTERM system TPR-repeat lipoprotein
MILISNSRLAVCLLVLTVLSPITAACSRSPETTRDRYLDSGNRYFTEGKYREAVIEYRNAVNADGRSGEARRRLAAAYLRTGDPASGLREQVRAADLLPQDAAAQIEAGNLLLLAGRFEDAKGRAKAALALDPANLGAQVLLGNSLAGLKDFDGAITEVEEALRLDPDRINTYATLGTLQLAKGQRDTAEATFQQAVTHQPRSADAQLALATFYWATGQMPKAEAGLRAALAINAQDARANRAMAAFLIGSCRRAEAEPYLIAAADSAPTAAGRVSLADYYVAMGRTEDASTLLRRIASEPGYESVAKLRLATIEFRAGRNDQATTLIDSILGHTPDDTEALLLKAGLSAARNQLDEAITLTTRAVTADPRSARARFALGRLYLRGHQLTEAKESFLEVLRLNPRAAGAQTELAKLYLAEGAVDKSMEFARQAITNDSGAGDARLTLARALIGRRNAAEAAPIVEQLQRAYPQSPAVAAQAGLLAVLKNDRAAASSAFTRALELDPDHVEAVAGLVSLDIVARQPDAARARVVSLLERRPSDSSAQLLAGRTFESIGDQRAEGAFRKAIETNPRNLEAYLALGRFYMRGNRLADAQREYEAAATRSSSPVAALTMVGIIQQSRGLTDQARQTYERVLQHDANAPIAANNLAWIYADSGVSLDIALQLAQTAKGALPKSTEVSDTLGWVFYRKGLLPQAIREFQQSVEGDPANPQYQFHLGLAWAKQGDTARAKKALETALQLRLADEDAAEARRAISAL